MTPFPKDSAPSFEFGARLTPRVPAQAGRSYEAVQQVLYEQFMKRHSTHPILDVYSAEHLSCFGSWITLTYRIMGSGQHGESQAESLVMAILTEL
jgi:hypothetical protein